MHTRTRRIVQQVICVAALLAANRDAMADAQAAGAPPPAEQVAWQVRLGLHSMQVSQAFGLVDRVVLVPDAATYLDELAKWRPDGRWPVLFDDDAYAPLFIRAFQPAQIVQRESIGQSQRGPSRQQLESIVVSAWGGDPGTDTVRTTFDRHRLAPLGIVVASTRDRAWTAAVALAAGRGQPLVFVEDRFGRADATIRDDQARSMRAAIDQAVNAAGYVIGGLGEGIDVITLCREMAGKVETSVPNDQQLNLAGASSDGPVALTDYIGRRAGGEHYAYTGWIFGDEAQSAYVAMCSLFLRPVDATLINTYGTGGEWSAFSTTPAAAALEAKGFVTHEHAGEAATPQSWAKLIERGFDSDFIIMNSSGGKDFFNLSGGRASASDVPVLHEPAILHLVHSWSMTAPASTATVGGRWLDHGVYAYVGSAHEPYLGAFLPPEPLVARLMSGVPFLIAARQWAGPFAVPWKVNTFGDPLLVVIAPDALPNRRIDRPVEGGAGVDLRANLAGWMRQAKDDASGVSAGSAMRVLNMLGQDDVAAQFWRALAGSEAARQAASPHVLPVFMRTQDHADFWSAWRVLPLRTERLESMLWHLVGPRLASLSDDELRQMHSAIRPSVAAEDVERLAPALTARFGRGHVTGVIQREIDRTDDRNVRRKLEELLSRSR